MAINVTIEFPAGSNSSVVQVMFPITDDEIGLEDVERFRLTLVIPEGVVGVEVGDPGMAYINVVDDDGGLSVCVWSECIFLTIPTHLHTHTRTCTPHFLIQ